MGRAAASRLRQSTQVWWSLDISSNGAFSRTIVVLAPSNSGAVLKGMEQLDDGESICTVCWTDELEGGQD